MRSRPPTGSCATCGANRGRVRHGLDSQSVRAADRVARQGRHCVTDPGKLERRYSKLVGRRTVEVNLRSEAEVRAALAEPFGVPGATPGAEQSRANVRGFCGGFSSE